MKKGVGYIPSLAVSPMTKKEIHKITKTSLESASQNVLRSQTLFSHVRFLHCNTETQPKNNTASPCLRAINLLTP